MYKNIDFKGIRDSIATAKDQALPHLTLLFEAFKKHAEAAGAKVHIAKDGRQANALIERIAKENRVKHIVKSKSMTAEETFLNDHLEEKGFKVTETDLRDWIIRLRHEGPSHMVIPAIHLSRYQVGELFEQVTNKKLFLVPGRLTDFVTEGDIISKCIAHQYFLIDKPSNQELTAIEKIES